MYAVSVALVCRASEVVTAEGRWAAAEYLGQAAVLGHAVTDPEWVAPVLVANASRAWKYGWKGH